MLSGGRAIPERVGAASVREAAKPGSSDVRNGRSPAVRAAVAALPGPQRAVIRMVVHQGLTVTAVARATGLPRETVIGLLAAAMRDLEGRLRQGQGQEARGPTGLPAADDAGGAPTGRQPSDSTPT